MANKMIIGSVGMAVVSVEATTVTLASSTTRWRVVEETAHTVRESRWFRTPLAARLAAEEYVRAHGTVHEEEGGR